MALSRVCHGVPTSFVASSSKSRHSESLRQGGRPAQVHDPKGQSYLDYGAGERRLMLSTLPKVLLITPSTPEPWRENLFRSLDPRRYLPGRQGSHHLMTSARFTNVASTVKCISFVRIPLSKLERCVLIAIFITLRRTKVQENPPPRHPRNTHSRPTLA
jgi:hypothetical protein